MRKERCQYKTVLRNQAENTSEGGSAPLCQLWLVGFSKMEPENELVVMADLTGEVSWPSGED